MKYDSITIDTQTVEHNGFHFDGGLLAQLRQFVDGPTEVVISIVVASEILRHLAEKTRSAKDALESAHKRAVYFGLKENDEAAFSGATPDTKTLARERLERFLKDIGTRLVQVDDVPMRDLLRKYFASAPPFGTSSKKKNEFPDAIALMSLEAWASGNDKHILAVSGDNDWIAYAEKSERIDVVSDLSEALAMLQEHAKEAEAIVQALLADMQRVGREKIKAQLAERLRDAVSSYEVYAEADSNYDTEGDDVQLTLLDYKLMGDEEEFAFKVVQAGPRKIVARIDLELEVKAQASFTLSVYDSIDKDYTPIGSAEAETEETIEGSALVTFAGDLGSGDVDITAVELVNGPDSIDFGFVQPDYDDDYEYDYEDDNR
jgi:PIN domain